MSSAAITTIVKMMESLPVEVHDRVAEHLREYINDLQDEIRWNESFERTQQQLLAAAKRAKQEIAEGQASELALYEATFLKPDTAYPFVAVLGSSDSPPAVIEEVDGIILAHASIILLKV